MKKVKNIKMRISIILTLLAILMAASLSAQRFPQPEESVEQDNIAPPLVPEVGKRMPYFELNNVHYYPISKVSANEFKGKWLILDFWTSTCLACFQSFPKLDMLQEEFKGKVQFLLIGDNEYKYGRNVEKIFNRIRDKHKLNLSVAYDSLLFNQWKIFSVPFTIIVDDKGIVRVVNAIRDLNSENLRLLIEKNDASGFKFIKWSQWDITKPFLIDGNGGPDNEFSFRSLMSKYKKPTSLKIPISVSRYNEMKSIIRKGFQASGISLTFLYNAAYFDQHNWKYGDSLYGNVAKHPIFEGSGPSPFTESSIAKELVNTYNYSLIVPSEKATTKFIMETMQRDLQTYFGYTARVEKRKMPYWKLISSDEAKRKLKSKGTTYYDQNTVSTGINFGNYPIGTLLATIEAFHQLEPPFIDETGIQGNIDLELDALLTDLENIRENLSKHGLSLVKSEREMTVLVVTNTENH